MLSCTNLSFADHQDGNGISKNGADVSRLFGGSNNFMQKQTNNISHNQPNNVGNEENQQVTMLNGCQSTSTSDYSFQSQYQQNTSGCSQHNNASDEQSVNKNGNPVSKNGDPVSKNGNDDWHREIFYCKGNDFLSLTFGNYINDHVQFNANQVMECSAGKGIFLNSEGKLNCGAHQNELSHSTNKSILYIHASKILAVKGECISPKGQIERAYTLFSRHSLYVFGSQYYSGASDKHIILD